MNTPQSSKPITLKDVYYAMQEDFGRKSETTIWGVSQEFYDLLEKQFLESSQVETSARQLTASEERSFTETFRRSPRRVEISRELPLARTALSNLLAQVLSGRTDLAHTDMRLAVSEAQRVLGHPFAEKTKPEPGMARTQILARARMAWSGSWPDQLTSGVMFYEGERITRDEFDGSSQNGGAES